MKIEVLLLLLVGTTLFGVVARKLRIPDAIVLVLAGLGVSLVPGLPHPELDPENVFLLVLPPLLYAQAWFTSWNDFRRWFRPIFMLAVGLVIFTTVLVAYALHALAPELPLPLCFALGAIVSPPDAVAASAIAQAFRLPKRMVTILEGESLVNDATGLVALKFSLVALSTGAFSPLEASGRFLLVAGGGVAVGLATSLVAAPLFKWLKDDALALALSLAIPYACFLLAERLHVSGILAVVACGIALGIRSSNILTANARLQGFGFWSTLVFLLNGAVFLLIGLQLPAIVAGMRGRSIGELIAIAAAVCGVVIAARLFWVFPGAYLPRLLSRRVREREPTPTWQAVTVVGWSGMRGVVSLAAALALPRFLHDGGPEGPELPLPGRDLLIFLSFSVVLCTLVLQGLTLPLLIRVLRVRGADDAEVDEERTARIAAASAALMRLKELADDPTVDGDAARIVIADFEDRLRRLHAGRASLVGDPGGEKKRIGSLRLRRVALLAARALVVDHHRRGELSRELLVKVERELDLEELQLAASETLAP
jgi:CPA1 family monovalent cation:H+ antiporter